MTGPSVLAGLSRPSSGRGHALLVAAVGQLAVELVDEVAAVGEDQDAAGAGRLHEAQRGHGLAGAGGVLEPEAARRRWGPRARRRQRPPPPPPPRRPSPAARRRRPSSSSPSISTSPRGQLLGVGRRSAVPPLPLRAAAACDSAVRAISVPDSASTWCAESSGAVHQLAARPRQSRRSRPSISENSRRHSTDGSSWPASSSASAASSARRRAVPGASAAAASSPSSTNGSRANSSARRRSAPEPAWSQPRKCFQP